MSGFLDGATRALILALSGFATLAIIGSIAAIPSGGVARQLGVGSEPVEVAAPQRAEQQAPVPEVTSDAGAGTGTEAVTAAPPPSDAPDAERWLEVIAYALIAIAGLLAVIALTLMRIAGSLRLRT